MIALIVVLHQQIVIFQIVDTILLIAHRTVIAVQIVRIRRARMLLKWIPCHRRIDRSLRIGKYTFPLCARCTAILMGYVFLPFLFIFSSYLLWSYIPILMIPLLIDGYTQKWKWRESNNYLRFGTGILFGIAQSILVVRSVIFLTKILM